MSDMERNKGTLYPATMEEIKAKYPEASLDDLRWDTDDEYIDVGGSLFRVDWDVKRDCDVPEFSDVTKTPDGTIYFHTWHYNGGGSLEEVLEERI